MLGVNTLDLSVSAKKVLVIDDEPDVRLSMSIYLENAGYEVTQASGGRNNMTRQYRRLGDLGNVGMTHIGA
jgi:CheY-like chemotaxis protein